MAPSTIETIGKKKRRRERKEGASTSSPVPGACEPRQRRRRTQREIPQTPGACILLSLI
jgi:hypothetical protein